MKKHVNSTGKKMFPMGWWIMLAMVLFAAPNFVCGAGYPDQGFIYGRIHMVDGSTYEGPIRWGTEEALWHDMFNSSKEENEYGVYLSSKELREIRENSGRGGFVGFLERIFTRRRSHTEALIRHQFVCRFGELKKMEMKGRSRVRLTFKKGDSIEVKGGSNDINTRINLIDREAGELNLKWSEIRSIEFMPVPQPLPETFGKPLYGTVETEFGSFEGFIQWDHQECLDSDRLDGEGEEGDISIEFADIKSIEKFKRGSLVTLHSGKEYYLYGTNDVNDDNRGVVINQLNLGKILVNWDEFDRVKFTQNPGPPPAGYNDFIEPELLAGKVKTKDGKIYAGRIVYDLDESEDFEILSGEHEHIEFHIPFRNIDRIVPEGGCCSRITLKNGLVIQLERERDVDRDNDGLLVWEDAEDPVYLAWEKIKEIKL